MPDPIKLLLEMRTFMSVRQTAQFLAITPSNLRKILSRGDMVGYKMAGRWTINPVDIAAYLHEHRNR